MFSRLAGLTGLLLLLPSTSPSFAAQPAGQLQAGAQAIDITPEKLPVLVNGGMTTRSADKVVDPLHARCLVLSDGSETIAIVVVDSCGVPRAILDEAKTIAAKATGIKTDRMLISATHTHSAPSVWGALGTDVDEAYAATLPAKIARGISLAHKKLEPARAGWGSTREPNNVFCRRYLMKEGTARTNPFSGKSNDRAQMNPGHANPNKIKRTGTVDDQLSILSVQSKRGRPIALLANYSTHYAGAPSLSADYFGIFAEKIAKKIKAENAEPAFVGMMSNGTSGDANCYDFERGKRREYDRFTVAEDAANAAFAAYQEIEYFDRLPIVMAEETLTLGVRLPTTDEVAKAKTFLQSEEGKRLRTIPAVYARETVLLSEMPPTRELKLQVIRIGNLGMTAIPNEVFSSTGLKIKQASPLKATFNISLANGCEGYIPPPDQHKLGGYTTWRARSSCLEENAEPKIRATVLGLLTEVSQKRADEKLLPTASGGRQSAESSNEPQVDDQSAATHIRGTNVPRSPLSPADSLKHLHVRPGMVVEVVAAEPLIRDPIAFDWGPDGKLWVVEMLDYPTGLNGKGKPGGRVVFLEDENDDGKYDKSTVFVDGLNFPMGVMAWREGILVTAAPDILYITDTDNDGQADKTEKLYSGFYEGNQQLRMNGLRWGLDNWIYCAGGSAAGTKGKPGLVKSHKTGQVVDLTGRDFRIKPDEGLIEPLSGWSQFGRNRDDWGNWFGCQNAKPMFHVVLEERYLKRNPYVTYPDPKVLISDIPGQRPVFPKSKPGKFHHVSQAGRFTSACSAMIYRDNLLGEEFYGNSFVCEPVHNLVHREIVERNGVTFRSYKPKDEENTEFLASEDPWFRPVMVRTGPDGALWIADMYREIIEHPRWVKDDLKPIVDTKNGTKFGRIYRVYAKGQPPRKVPKLDRLSPKELVGALDHPNGTFRDLIHRRLVQHPVDEVVKPLETFADSHPRDAARLQAIGVLDGMDRLDFWLALEVATQTPMLDPMVMRLCEGKLNKVHASILIMHLLRREYPPQLVMQRIASVGDFDLPELGRAMFLVAARRPDEPYLRAAMLSSLDKDKVDYILRNVHRNEWRELQPDLPMVKALIDTAIEYKCYETLAIRLGVIAGETESAPQPWALDTMAYAYQRLSQPMEPYHVRLEVTNPRSPLRQKIDALAKFAREAVVDDRADLPSRLASVRLLVALPSLPDDDALLSRLLNPRIPIELQTQVVQSLADKGEVEGAALLLSKWTELSPRVRTEVVSAMLSRSTWSAELLTQIEKAQIDRRALSTAQRGQLEKSRNNNVSRRARAIFASETKPEVAELIAHYQASMSDAGDAAGHDRGAAVFKKRCASCHRLGTDGTQVGPDLRGLTDKSPEFLLTSILDPNRAVDPRYVSYRAVTTEGRIHTGLIDSEAGDSLTLLIAEGKRQAILRSELDELSASGKSLMPEGLHRDISPEQMADLLAYLNKALASP